MGKEDSNPPSGSTEPTASDRLDSWKEIGAYLKRDVRTAQRWEATEALPVYRHLHRGRASVYAYKFELDAWWSNRRPKIEAQETQAVEDATTRSMPWAVGLALGLLLVTGLAAWYLTRAQPADSIAVLPFVNATGDPGLDYLSDGFTESLIASLSQLDGLARVIARSSVFRYQGLPVDPQRVGRELGVRSVLTGRLSQQGDELVVDVELVNVQDASRLWGHQYRRKPTEIFAVQEEIAWQIERTLRLSINPADRQRLAHRYPQNAEAYHLYLKGRYFWNKGSEEGFRKALDFLQQAIEKDSNYALAYAGLADSYGSQGDYGLAAPREVFPLARSAAARALELDSQLAEAHTSLAWILYEYDWNWARAEVAFRKALGLNPNYATAHRWYSLYLTAMGRNQEAVAEAKRALELDPFSLIINANLALVLQYAQHYDEATEQCQATLELDPRFAPAHHILGRAYLQKGKYENAIAAFKEAATLSPEVVGFRASLAYAYAMAGEEGRAKGILSALQELSQRKYVSPYEIAEVHVALGNPDRAFHWLEKAYTDRLPDMTYLKTYPRLDPLRSDPRFQDLLRRMNFPD